MTTIVKFVVTVGIKKFYNNPIIKNNRKFYQIKKNYNLSETDFNNMIINQNNKCLICNKEFKFKDDSNKHIHIDHNHKTGNVRGLLCPKCNLLLGICNDNVEILKSAIQYLKEHN
jgi:hypothetical protein